MLIFDPARLWYLSTILWKKKHRRTARLIKAYNFFFFRAILPPEADLLGVPRLGHYAMNIVVHPNVSLGRDVFIWHGVTLSVSDTPGTSARLIIGDRVTIGTGTVIVTPLKRGLSVCSDVVIGANSVVSRPISIPGTYAGAPAKYIERQKEQV